MAKSPQYVIGFLLGFFGNFILLLLCLFFGGDYFRGALHGFIVFWLLALITVVMIYVFK